MPAAVHKEQRKARPNGVYPRVPFLVRASVELVAVLTVGIQVVFCSLAGLPDAVTRSPFHY